MRTVFYLILSASMALAAWSAQDNGQAPKKTTAKKRSAKKTKAAPSPSKSASTSKTGSRKSSSKRGASKGGKKGAPGTTWRNRQLAPTPERYREIQNALAVRGYLDPQQATGSWGASSVEALKRFQAEQNLDATGKIDSMSLIALGLGPKRAEEPAAKATDAKPAESPKPPEPR